jgi:hypothetical protein
MDLHEQATADLATMHNVAEFADALSINGAPAVPCILDDELAPTPHEGVREWDATLYVRASDLLERPVIDQRLELVGDRSGTRSATVVHSNTTHGEHVIRLKWFES